MSSCIRKLSDPTFSPRKFLRSSGRLLVLGAHDLHLLHNHHHVCEVAPKWSIGGGVGGSSDEHDSCDARQGGASSP